MQVENEKRWPNDGEMDPQWRPKKPRDCDGLVLELTCEVSKAVWAAAPVGSYAAAPSAAPLRSHPDTARRRPVAPTD